VWLLAARALYHVEHRRPAATQRARQPVLVSVVSESRNVELLGRNFPKADPLRLPHDENSLSFLCFSGSYEGRRTPAYEYRLGYVERWTKLDPGSRLRLLGMRDGTYDLQMRIAENYGSSGLLTAFHFEILPPWYRAWYAIAAYGLSAVLTVLGIVRWISHRSRQRNVVLEQLVRDRTRQLETAMEKLNEETRHAATLAERNRLAGEIHDSIQQGLSGAILQLDTILNLPAGSGEVHSRLNIARNMVSYTREEVQHAVWDMESPLLENAELGEALRKLTAFINSGATTAAPVEIAVGGVPVPLAPTMKHHLLRMAQEATTNAVRHAKPQRIAVNLAYQPASVTLTVIDDGVGFDPDEVMSKTVGHFGLRGLRGRARKMGGQLLIHSSPGAGTTIRVTVPLDSKLLDHDDTKNGSI
jgi:signal transduction histidine kinase